MNDDLIVVAVVVVVEAVVVVVVVATMHTVVFGVYVCVDVCVYCVLESYCGNLGGTATWYIFRIGELREFRLKLPSFLGFNISRV